MSTFLGKYTVFVLASVIVLLSPGRGNAELQTVSLPISIDYPLLRNLLISNAFTEKGDSATLLNEGGGCIYLALSTPQVSWTDGAIKLDLRVSARAGTPFGGECYTPLEWQGYLTLYQQPSITPDTWEISFVTVGTQLLEADRRPARITGLLWNLIEPHIKAYLAKIRINLAPPIVDMKNFIFPLFPEAKRLDTERMLASMRPGKILVEPDSVRLAVLADVAIIYDPNEKAQEVDEKEIQRTVALWEKWDGLLVYLVTALSKHNLGQEEKRILTNVLLDTRYRFITELSDRTIQHDIVRQQFVSVWQQLSPIFRKHILRDSEISLALGYLAFVGSADALLVFDKLGPTLGLEISTSGLVRLTRMLHADPELLQYRLQINPYLQKLFEFEPTEPDPSPGPPDTHRDSSILHRIFDQLSFSGTVFAAQPQPSFEDILHWKVPKSDVTDYLQRVEQILASSSNSMIAMGKIPNRAEKMYRVLIPAMAWQESCFRQFVVKGDKLTYLLSYNQSSVGLMQVNERVWRGLYSLDRLRWDIGYNAAAGSEIAALYLNKYALRDREFAQTLDDDTLARLVYAMYNGGPSQYNKFLERLKTNRLYGSDNLFWEKYSWVSAGQMNKVSKCLVGQ